ncbi:hypothetical protein FHS49_002399 [Sphingobium boeckii]|uniref:Uncharacterized protein n=1 Tax=Sphingobium boeckii TaxID=1082345 RepID=A0A7W9EFU2_9SPHN|nr:hypothetical protein [Sphingobium boeckii]
MTKASPVPAITASGGASSVLAGPPPFDLA